MWNAITDYFNRIFQFILQGNPAQEIIPFLLLGIGLFIVLIFLRISRGDA